MRKGEAISRGEAECNLAIFKCNLAISEYNYSISKIAQKIMSSYILHKMLIDIFQDSYMRSGDMTTFLGLFQATLTTFIIIRLRSYVLLMLLLFK